MHHIQHLYLALTLPSSKAGVPTLPGLGTLMSLISDVTTFGLVLALAGFIISAIRLGIGHHAGNPGEVTKAKHALLFSLVAAILLGGAKTLINFAGGISL